MCLQEYDQDFNAFEGISTNPEKPRLFAKNATLTMPIRTWRQRRARSYVLQAVNQWQSLTLLLHSNESMATAGAKEAAIAKVAGGSSCPQETLKSQRPSVYRGKGSKKRHKRGGKALREMRRLPDSVDCYKGHCGVQTSTRASTSFWLHIPAHRLRAGREGCRL